MSAVDSSVALQEAASPDKYFHTAQRDYSGTNKEDQYVLKAYPVRTTYRAYASAVSTATSLDQLIFIQADGSNYTFINGIRVTQSTLAGSPATAKLRIIRTSTAGSGGGAVSAYPMDAADASPYAGTIQTLPSSKGTEGVTLFGGPMGMTDANPMTTANQFFYRFGDDEKGILIGTAVTDGVCIKIITGISSGAVDVVLEFTTAPQK